MSIKTIRSKFMLALAAYATSHNPPLPLAREGESFTKPVDGSSWLEAYIVPSNTTNRTVDGLTKTYWGEFVINVWVEENNGAGLGEVIAEELSNLFPVFPKNYLPVTIEQTASVKRAIEDVAGWRIIPVCIPYRAEFTTN